MHILVLGAYGFIGLQVCRRLLSAGHSVSGLGRSDTIGRQLLPELNWFSADLRHLHSEDDWRPLLDNVDVVVNAAGALQTGLADDPAAVHDAAVAALLDACVRSRVRSFVQISAAGADESASTEFFRSKARGDAHVRASSLDWTILRPGLVIGSNAYGGTALLRMLASLPVVQLLAYGDRPVQTVALTDLSELVLDAVESRLAPRQTLDVVHADRLALRQVVRSFRRWLGLPEPRFCIDIPDWLARAVARVADVLGRLGWRSPLRSTSMKVLANGIQGETPHALPGGRELMSFDDTLASMPSTIQERWFGRLYLLMPLLIATLSMFWIASGAIALANLPLAVAQSGLSGSAARLAVVGGSLLDILLGCALLLRPWAAVACAGMLLLSLVYLVAGSILRPELWADPLGPLVKIFPAAVLALLVLALLRLSR